MFTADDGDDLIEAAAETRTRTESIQHAHSLDETFGDDFAPAEFLSPFVDDVEFEFPGGDANFLDDLNSNKRSRMDSTSFDVGPGLESMGSFGQWGAGDLHAPTSPGFMPKGSPRGFTALGDDGLELGDSKDSKPKAKRQRKSKADAKGKGKGGKGDKATEKDGYVAVLRIWPTAIVGSTNRDNTAEATTSAPPSSPHPHLPCPPDHDLTTSPPYHLTTSPRTFVAHSVFRLNREKGEDGEDNNGGKPKGNGRGKGKAKKITVKSMEPEVVNSMDMGMKDLGGEVEKAKGKAKGKRGKKGKAAADKPAAARAKAKEDEESDDDEKDDENSTEHLEDLLAVLERVAPVDGSHEIFDSDDDVGDSDEDDEKGDNGDGSDGSDDELDMGIEMDVKSSSSASSAMNPPSAVSSFSSMAGLAGLAHPGLGGPAFDMHMLHGAPTFKMDMDDRKSKGGRKRPKITPEEKAELLRQRNREHARSTRRRKKMYVECLKKQVAELLAKQQQIDSGIFEPLSGTQAEEITIRKAIIQTFLQYRTTNVLDRSRWRDLLDDAFSLTQPRTPFRATNIGEIFGNNRRVKGIDAVVQDTASVTAMLEMIKSRVRQQKPDYRRSVTMSYNVDSSDILVVSDKLMCHWSTSTNGLVAAGFSSECSVDGMLKCTFNSKHKLLDMEITYDVMAFTRQMQQHSLIDLSVVANSARSNPMMRTPASGKLPLRTPGAMMPMAGMKHPNMKRAKSMGTFGPRSFIGNVPIDLTRSVFGCSGVRVLRPLALPAATVVVLPAPC
mmetsp:Transcript_100509/g.287825  ORF Transcript_100509/g.287825 Transcript_100509/m.287825 type:complete len:780 (+) Transcript_100509:179-2518(+)